ncbi:MAG: metal ABC transporter permease [Phycisphaerae bacterium]|nr:MAG: iron ABC transporter [Planctomycetota bacterium]KAB2944839.1 MAG: iron ABC transporter [Phycisphaerae bacterium]MBE7456840.1 metal ABC transporter permease [Planctomycetia bacterium]MCK6464288.1 metal ABC transporter permease [Phycisphaerae bacterium]MCL4717880.1 metal ABC transporter permease [Phycisphaerae bacterium]
MNWSSYDTWIVLTGALCAGACALPGTFLILRRMSMMGDAISHAVLPGLAAAFMLTGSRGSWVMFAGAAVVGVLTALFTQWVNRLGKVEESAAMGVVFTALFALGLVMLVQAADDVDLDPGCVLYGSLELAPLDARLFFGTRVPRAALMLGAVFLVNLVLVIAFYKELRISSFDPELSTTLGIPAGMLHYGLMTMVAVTTVAAFESVGSILVIAMLIVPAASARLLTDRLWLTLALAVVLGAGGAALGHVGAIVVPSWFGFADTSTAGMMAVAAGAIFALCLLAGPRHGLVSRVVHRLGLALRIAREDILGLLYRLEEAGDLRRARAGEVASLMRSAIGGGRAVTRIALADLRRRGRVTLRSGELRLTPLGREDARKLVRSHRLWETYVARHFALPPDHLHPSAGRTEHYLSRDMRRAIEDEADLPKRDPHGAPIPERTNEPS